MAGFVMSPEGDEFDCCCEPLARREDACEFQRVDYDTERDCDHMAEFRLADHRVCRTCLPDAVEMLGGAVVFILTPRGEGTWQLR